MPNEEPIVIYLAPDGEDKWSGKLPERNADGSDGPLRTPQHAATVVRDLKQSGGMGKPVEIRLRGGRYFLDAPLTLSSGDSGPITWTSYPNERASLSGGKLIEGWREETVNGVRAWCAEIPEVAAGEWYFHQLWVNGTRAMRPRLPREGFYRMEDVPDLNRDDYIFKGANRFIAAPGDIRSWNNLTDVEVVLLHFWIEERMPLVSYDEATHLVTGARKSRMNLKDERDGWAKYYVENVFEELREPGDWYLDRGSGRIYYVPREGEGIETLEAIAPVLDHVLSFKGSPDAGKYVEYLRFTNIDFEHTTWSRPEDGTAAWSQSANGLSGAVRFEGARYCGVEDCAITHIGTYGVEIGAGCSGIRFIGNEITDAGAGGVKIGGTDWESPRERWTGNCRITDNHLHDLGVVHHAGVGVLAMHSFGNSISHNHIHDLYYSGISCGWVWGYRDNVSKNNLIEKNHIHDLGKGWLSDMGGIYTLGVQPGTVLRGNLIHDVTMAGYGGWAIYPDEGSSHILIENNIGYNTTAQPFHQHYGRENIVRNNIWAFGHEGQVRITRIEPHLSLTFERNIVLTEGHAMHRVDERERPNYRSDLNLYWDVSGEPVEMTWKHSDDFWRDEIGNDRHTIVADPKMADPKNGDFTLAEDSPAIALGFVPFDLSDAGPRPAAERD